MPGPVPKRAEQRRRRNKADTDTGISDGEVRGPALPNANKHSTVAKRWYEALRQSGQAQFFEASDWAQAELVVAAIDAFVKTPSASLLASIQTMSTGLLVTEGDRRRLRVELEKPKPEEDTADVSWLDSARRRRDGAGAA